MSLLYSQWSSEVASLGSSGTGELATDVDDEAKHDMIRLIEEPLGDGDSFFH